MKRFLVCLILLAAPMLFAQESLEWTDLPPLPDAFGFGGPVVGTHNGALIVAGGANFPDGPPWSEEGNPAGAKVWHDRIFVLTPGATEWIAAGKLPYPIAYASVISTDGGVYVIGGETFTEKNHPTDAIMRLEWNSDTNEIVVTENALAPLPKPSHYHNGAMLDGIIYITASHAASETSTRLDTKSFWALDLNAPAEERAWESLAAWPGPPREKMAVAVQNAGADGGYATPACLFMFSGATWAKDANGETDLTAFEYFTDAWRYNPKSGEWTQLADLPPMPELIDVDTSGYALDENGVWRRLKLGETQAPPDIDAVFGERPRAMAASAASAVGQSHILIFSGDAGHYLTTDVGDRPLFPRDVMAYHTITDTWTKAGEMPIGVVTTSPANWEGRIVIPSGEVRPGIRTNRVQALEIPKAATSFGVLNMIVLVLYLAALVGMGVYFSRREKGTDDFFLAGNRIPWWAAGISIYATQLSAITFVSIPAVAYAGNWLVYPGNLMIFFFAPVVIYFYLPFFRKLNVTTAYEYLEKRFNVLVRLFGSLSFIIFQFGRMAVVVYLPALALSAVTGLNIYACIIGMGVLSTLYTVLGGMEAVIWTDVLQVFVLWGGMLLAIVIITLDVGGVSEVFSIAKADGKLTVVNWSTDFAQLATWLIVLGNIALQFGPYTTDQAVVQRYMTTKDEPAARRSIWLNGFLTLPFSLLFFILGSCLYVFFKAHPELLTLGMENDKVFPLFMANQLPAGLSGLVIAGVFAASMSSLDSSMHSVATAITVDFYGRFKPEADDAARLKLARTLTILVGATGTAIALLLAGSNVTSLFFLFQKLLGLISSGLVGIFILGIFTQRANAVGSLVGAVSSFVVLCIVVFQTEANFYLYAPIGIATAVIVGYVVSRLTGSSSKPISGLTWHTRNESLPE